MKINITINGKTKTKKLRDITHLEQVIKNRSSVTKDKSKVIPRKRKYKDKFPVDEI